MLKKSSNILPLIILLIVFLLLYPSSLMYFTDSFDYDPTIIVCGDFSLDGFGEYVFRGINKAKQDSKSKNFNIAKIHINEYTFSEMIYNYNYNQDKEIKRFEKDMISTITKKNVLGIISANTTQTVNTVVKFANTFNIPTLITVSTNENVIETDNTWALRLIPSDREQSKTLAGHIRGLLNKKDVKIGLLTSPTIYGRELRNTLNNIIKKPDLMVPFSLGTTTDIAGVLMYGSEMGINYWIALTYRNEAIEIYSKKKSRKIEAPLLLSDGAFGDWLFNLTDTTIYISLPRAKKQSFKMGDMIAYSIYGYDSYISLYWAFESFKKNKGKSKRDFFNLLRNILETNNKIADNYELKSEYKFDDVGNNINNSFSIYGVQHGKIVIK